MLHQIWTTFIDFFGKNGAECLGYFVMALCFGMFFLRSTQKRRFHLISSACYVLATGAFLQVIFPILGLLNPHFTFSEKGYQLIQLVFICSGASLVWSSVFVNVLGFSALIGISIAFFLLQGTLVYFIQPIVPAINLSYVLLTLSWIVAGLSFHFLQAGGKTSLFGTVGDAFFVLSLYYIARELGISGTVWFPIIVFGGSSVVVLMAQIKFMEATCVGFEANLKKEKERRTLFWDIAPFPILVSRLLDDSVLYINPRAQEVLKVSNNETSQFHLNDYFIDKTKREELIMRARLDKIVNHFVVQMKSPRTLEDMWLDLSARVVELDGELALYMNLQNITAQKQNEEKLFKQASTDALTGLYNRRQFEAMSSMALANCIRQKRPYCVMMLDIDHFKHVNDTYGHDKGDLVLQKIADVLRQTHRASDVIARYGGEEFIFFLTNTDIEGAKIAAERVRSAVEKTVIMADDKQIPVTISLGISATQNGDIYAMTKEADIALYHSKEGGRNRYTVFSEEMRTETGEKE